MVKTSCFFRRRFQLFDSLAGKPSQNIVISPVFIPENDTMIRDTHLFVGGSRQDINHGHFFVAVLHYLI